MAMQGYLQSHEHFMVCSKLVQGNGGNISSDQLIPIPFVISLPPSHGHVEAIWIWVGGGNVVLGK